MVLRVVCPYPNHGRIMKQTEDSLEALVKSGLFTDVQIGRIQGTCTARGRNEVINAVQENGKLRLNMDFRKYQELPKFDYFMSNDADIEYTPDHVAALLEKDVPIVSGAYLYRRNSELFTAGKFVNGIPGLTDTSHFFQSKCKGMIEADWVGAGFLLIKREALQALPNPWFWQGHIEYSDGVQTRICYVTDDIGFSMNANQCGFTIFLDCDTKVIHHI